MQSVGIQHDHTRRHSPVIKGMPVVYIKENKSIAEYIRQLSDMGENIDDYSSIWWYNVGQTGPRFTLYEYPRPLEQYTTSIQTLQGKTILVNILISHES